MHSWRTSINRPMLQKPICLHVYILPRNADTMPRDSFRRLQLSRTAVRMQARRSGPARPVTGHRPTALEQNPNNMKTAYMYDKSAGIARARSEAVARRAQLTRRANVHQTDLVTCLTAHHTNTSKHEKKKSALMLFLLLLAALGLPSCGVQAVEQEKSASKRSAAQVTALQYARQKRHNHSECMVMMFICCCMHWQSHCSCRQLALKFDYWYDIGHLSRRLVWPANMPGSTSRLRLDNQGPYGMCSVT